MATRTRGTYWKMVWGADGGALRDVGIAADGTLHNPHGYPEELVRASIAGALDRQRARRSAAAQKAAKTRKARQEAKVYEVVEGIASGKAYGPADNCVCCWKGLDDPESIRRGIGSDCWQRVLKLVKERQQRLEAV